MVQKKFVNDLILYTENPKGTTIKLRINKFKKLKRYKNQYVKSTISLYTNNQAAEKLRKKIPFTIAPKVIKYPGINLIRK